MGFLFTNGICISLDENNTIYNNGAVYVEKDVIKDIGDSNELKKKYQGVEQINVNGKVIMPGYINLHSHFYSAFARGMSSSGEAPKDFVDILEKVWWKLDKVLDLEDVYHSGMLCCVDNIKNGTTTIFDHHASPYHCKGSLYELEKAFHITGLRGNLCYEVSDRDGEKISNEGIEENSEFISKCNNSDNDRVKGLFGIHASFTVNDSTLNKISEQVKKLNTGIHIHCAEDKADQDECLKEHNMRVVERLEKFDVLSERSFLVHCIHVDDNEMNIINKNKCTVIHNPESNMNNAVGVSNIIKMNELGINLALGTDGYSAKMGNGIRLIPILHRLENKNPSIGYDVAYKLPFVNNAKIASKFYNKPIGMLKKGYYADIIVHDYMPPTPMSSNSFMGHYIFGIAETPVIHTMVAGKFLMRNREVLLVDEREVLKNTNKFAEKVWKKL